MTFASGEVVSADLGWTGIARLGVGMIAVFLTSPFTGEETTEEVFCVENEDRGNKPNFSLPGKVVSRS